MGNKEKAVEFNKKGNSPVEAGMTIESRGLKFTERAAPTYQSYLLDLKKKKYREVVDQKWDRVCIAEQLREIAPSLEVSGGFPKCKMLIK